MLRMVATVIPIDSAGHTKKGKREAGFENESCLTVGSSLGSLLLESVVH
jgi:hypothetical protein